MGSNVNSGQHCIVEFASQYRCCSSIFHFVEDQVIHKRTILVILASEFSFSDNGNSLLLHKNHCQWDWSQPSLVYQFSTSSTEEVILDILYDLQTSSYSNNRPFGCPIIHNVICSYTPQHCLTQQCSFAYV